MHIFLISYSNDDSKEWVINNRRWYLLYCFFKSRAWDNMLKVQRVFNIPDIKIQYYNILDNNTIIYFRMCSVYIYYIPTELYQLYKKFIPALKYVPRYTCTLLGFTCRVAVQRRLEI